MRLPPEGKIRGGRGGTPPKGVHLVDTIRSSLSNSKGPADRTNMKGELLPGARKKGSCGVRGEPRGLSDCFKGKL